MKLDLPKYTPTSRRAALEAEVHAVAAFLRLSAGYTAEIAGLTAHRTRDGRYWVFNRSGTLIHESMKALEAAKSLVSTREHARVGLDAPFKLPPHDCNED